jgi:hypothetical protein
MADGHAEGIIIPLARVAFDQDGSFNVAAPPTKTTSYKLIGLKVWGR